ncbi:hypothetical protein BGZ47_006262 [Haplosporangium gracile]|nr:hypothetical protein BGZ47_006262 [Haplosporangium gracile]
MSISRFDLINSLLDCVLFECAQFTGQCTVKELAECFDFIRGIPCGGYYECHSDSDEELIQQYETVECISLRRLQGHEVESFLFQYAVLVPRVCHNDIAVLIQGLRDNVWTHKG